jgi:ferritin
MQPMDPDLQRGFQAQTNQERQNRDVYQDFESRFIRLGLMGFAAWAHEQAHEERHHAKRFGRYLADVRGIIPEIQATPAQAFPFTDPLMAFEHGAELEAKNSGLISDLYDQAELVGDNGACLFLHYFIREQERSEADYDQWIMNLKMIAGDGTGIRKMDREFLKKYGD